MKTLLLIFTLFCSANTIACGSVSQNFQKYGSMKTIEAKEGFLVNHSCYLPINYNPLIADPIIVEVVASAIDDGVNQEIISNVIDEFNCMYGAYYTKEYDVVTQFILDNRLEHICNDSRFETSYVIIAKSGANLRSKPSTSGDKLASIEVGVLVKVQRIEGSWAYLESYSGNGYIYLPLLKALKLDSITKKL